MSKIKLSETFIKDRVKLALTEDLYPYGDITSNLINNNKIIEAKIISNQKAIVAGLLFVASCNFGVDGTGGKPDPNPELFEEYKSNMGID